MPAVSASCRIVLLVPEPELTTVLRVIVSPVLDGRALPKARMPRVTAMFPVKVLAEPVSSRVAGLLAEEGAMVIPILPTMFEAIATVPVLLLANILRSAPLLVIDPPVIVPPYPLGDRMPPEVMTLAPERLSVAPAPANFKLLIVPAEARVEFCAAAIDTLVLAQVDVVVLVLYPVKMLRVEGELVVPVEATQFASVLLDWPEKMAKPPKIPPTLLVAVIVPP